MILDNIRFRANLVGRNSWWALAVVGENDDYAIVHRLTKVELRQILALPDVLSHFESGPQGYPHVGAMAQRIAELQAIVDKRKDEREWEPRATNRGATAEALWQLLDDIDTLSDQIKPTNIDAYIAFYNRSLDIAKRRHLFLKSDGYKLTWPSGVGVERGGHPRAQVVPEPSVRTEADASFWRDRYEDLKLGVRNRLAGEQVQPTFEENAVLLANMLSKPEAPGNDKYRDLVDCVERAVGGYDGMAIYAENAALVRPISELFNRAHAATRAPVPMLLHCPMCHARHIDEGEFATKAHHTHACQGYVMEEGKRRRCGHVWRPAIVPTVGVEALPGFINEQFVEGEKLVGKRARCVANSFHGIIESFDPEQSKYLVKGELPSSGRLGLLRHEFTVLE